MRMSSVRKSRRNDERDTLIVIVSYIRNRVFGKSLNGHYQSSIIVCYVSKRY